MKHAFLCAVLATLVSLFSGCGAEPSDAEVLDAAHWVKLSDAQPQSGIAPNESFLKTAERKAPGIVDAMDRLKQIKHKIDRGDMPDAKDEFKKLVHSFPQIKLVYRSDEGRYTRLFEQWSGAAGPAEMTKAQQLQRLAELQAEATWYQRLATHKKVQAKLQNAASLREASENSKATCDRAQTTWHISDEELAAFFKAHLAEMKLYINEKAKSSNAFYKIANEETEDLYPGWLD